MRIRKDRKIERYNCNTGNTSYFISAVINLVAAITDFVVGGATGKPLLIVGGVCFTISSILYFISYFSSRR